MDKVDSRTRQVDSHEAVNLKAHRQDIYAVKPQINWIEHRPKKMKQQINSIDAARKLSKTGPSENFCKA
ncbi:uncharacterized protein CPUR_08726 [Claviceps purpurea 20.1]|uniref:Uncharacterized protein n=1 Tax=Claviceps purpurea (strain 20.1) TaxID=1111077 RepID=M1WDG6_CLAP2|nr:hypothetical protein E4U46_000266 [Claviceps purpurea]CCE34790.1 uncharacterized protein CPUR_08726 [Claviceps purpurea 20.1]